MLRHSWCLLGASFGLACRVGFPTEGAALNFASPEISVNTPLFCQEMAPSVFFHSPVAGLAALTRRSRRRAGIRGSAATDPVKTVAVLATSRVSRLF